MRKKFLILFIIITIVSELTITTIYIKKKPDYKNDTTKINELTKQIEMNFGNFGDGGKNYNDYEYSIIDNNEAVLYKTKDSISTSLNEAYKNKDTIVDLYVNGDIVGKLIINNNYDDLITKTNKSYVTSIIIISIIQILSLVLYYIYLYINVIMPFRKMKVFASRVSDGNLDIPLTMDKNNNFGAFTEAFDIMRHEIKKSRKAEKKAMESKKELIAKLSHDIKTPIASIKSSSELGLATTNELRSKTYFESINQKSDQINNLVNNLFNSSLDELEELNVNAREVRSGIIKDLINNADYLHKNGNYTIPNCNLFLDRLRMQQVFDNIFANSYKYANTNVETITKIEDEYLIISIRDFGDGVEAEELPLLMEKFKRGTNTQDKDGVGLGLYISNELLKKMNGKLEIKNGNPGFVTKIYLRII
ncbi:MAG: HAMP domain-containing histidine kinase [Clostridia bacterium]|nr:HAMP domain-containing histidine kinase [Clostridia bacterium]